MENHKFGKRMVGLLIAFFGLIIPIITEKLTSDKNPMEILITILHILPYFAVIAGIGYFIYNEIIWRIEDKERKIYKELNEGLESVDHRLKVQGVLVSVFESQQTYRLQRRLVFSNSVGDILVDGGVPAKWPDFMKAELKFVRGNLQALHPSLTNIEVEEVLKIVYKTNYTTP